MHWLQFGIGLKKKNDESVFKAHQVLTKFVLISISFVAAHVAFPLEQKISREEVDLVMKTVSTLIVAGIALTDLYFNTKRRTSRK